MDDAASGAGPANEPPGEPRRVRSWSGGSVVVAERTRTIAWVSAQLDGEPGRIPAAAVARHPHPQSQPHETEPLLKLDARGVAVVAGVSVSLPTDGRSLVALVDFAADGAVTVTAHAMRLDPPPPVGAPGWRDLGAALRARWLGGPPAPPLLPRVYPQLFADPVVAAFLDLPPAPADG